MLGTLRVLITHTHTLKHGKRHTHAHLFHVSAFCVKPCHIPNNAGSWEGNHSGFLEQHKRSFSTQAAENVHQICDLGDLTDLNLAQNGVKCPYCKDFDGLECAMY